MAQYILHIGYGKTGTTALQSFLHSKRHDLLESGILYPDFIHNGVYLNVKDHNMLGYALAGQQGWTKMSTEEYFNQINMQLEKNVNLHTVLLSGETLVGMPQPHKFGTELEYWDEYEKKVEKLRYFIGDGKHKIIIYLRRQDHWLEASLNQTVKYYGLSKTSRTRLSFLLCSRDFLYT